MVVAAPFGAMAVFVTAGRVSHVRFLEERRARAPSDPAAAEVARQLEAYLDNPRFRFNVSLDLNGSPFQRRVWRALQQIPVGTVTTYGELARQLDSSARAVGGACRANPVPLFVPCHRVVSAEGLGGFSGESRGYPIETKRWLLVHEGALLT